VPPDEIDDSGAGFFSLLLEEATVAKEMAQAMKDLMTNYKNIGTARKDMKELEHRADEIVHRIHEAINETFITPIEREDLRDLASKLDEVVDMLYATVLRLDLYQVAEPDDGMRRLTDIVLESVTKLHEAMSLVKERGEGDRIEKLCVEVNHLENTADEVMNEAIASLFQTQDAITVIKLKEIYEKMEQATDFCEDVADTLSDIVAKNR
jgi:predicted phosphate transport protein (TIGR00153 family)